jgi:preprotein translocase subunit SecG
MEYLVLAVLFLLVCFFVYLLTKPKTKVSKTNKSEGENFNKTTSEIEIKDDNYEAIPNPSAPKPKGTIK